MTSIYISNYQLKEEYFKAMKQQSPICGGDVSQCLEFSLNRKRQNSARSVSSSLSGFAAAKLVDHICAYWMRLSCSSQYRRSRLSSSILPSSPSYLHLRRQQVLGTHPCALAAISSLLQPSGHQSTLLLLNRCVEYT